MSGHSKWSTIKRKKGALDAKRGRIFSKLAKEITVAARTGGSDVTTNPRLRTVLLASRSQNMPKDNIDRAIKKGTGEIPGIVYEETRYEAYGPAGVAFIVDVLSDNKNRTVAEIRHILTKNNGAMAETGAVGWNFDRKGIITVAKTGLTDDEIFEKAIEAGADDVDTEGDMYELKTADADLHTVVHALEQMGVKVEEAKLTMVPKTTVKVEGSNVGAILRLMESLEDNEDVQDFYANYDISDQDMAAAMN